MMAMNQWILVLEDEKDLKDLLTDQLIRAGFRVLSSGKAGDAIRLLRNQKFACVLLDIRLEGGLGSNIIFSLREDKRQLNHTTPILVTSGQLNADLVLKIKDLVNGVFVKPFDLMSLVAKVSSLCSQQN